jgi:hypothetical protein
VGRQAARAKDDLQTLHRIACLGGFAWPVIDLSNA